MQCASNIMNAEFNGTTADCSCLPANCQTVPVLATNATCANHDAWCSFLCYPSAASKLLLCCCYVRCCCVPYIRWWHVAPAGWLAGARNSPLSTALTMMTTKACVCTGAWTVSFKTHAALSFLVFLNLVRYNASTSTGAQPMALMLSTTPSAWTSATMLADLDHVSLSRALPSAPSSFITCKTFRHCIISLYH